MASFSRYDNQYDRYGNRRTKEELDRMESEFNQQQQQKPQTNTKSRGGGGG